MRENHETPTRGRSRVRTFWALALVLALLVGVAACGDDDDDTSASADDGAEASDDGGEASDDGGETSDDGADASDDGADASDDGADASDDGADASDDGGETSDDGAEPMDIAQEGCDSVVIGVIMSTSGIYSQLGADATIAVESFSATHPEILGTPLEFDVENDGSDPTTAVGAIQRLLDDDCVVAIMGPTGVAQSLAILPIAVENTKPLMMLTPIPYPNFNAEPYIFSPNLAQLPMQVQLFSQYWADQGVENPIIITSDDGAGDVVQAAYEGAGFDVERVPLAVTDYEPVIAGLMDDGYDAVAYFGGSGGPAGQIALARAALGWDVDYYQAPSTLNTDYFEVAGDAAEGTRGLVWPAALDPATIDNPDQRAAVEEIQAAVGDDVDLGLQPLVGSDWDAALSLYLAMEEAQSSDPADIQAVLDGQTFYGANGQVIRVPVGDDGGDHLGVQLESAGFGVVENGTFVPLG